MEHSAHNFSLAKINNLNNILAVVVIIGVQRYHYCFGHNQAFAITER
jgi:hypothetical protein